MGGGVVVKSIYLLMFVLWGGCFNCLRVKGGGVGQKVLNRAS